MRLTRNRIFGAIGVVWGSGIAVSGLFRVFSDNAAYAAGRMAGLLLGLAMFGVGLYYAIKG
jgi:hypothetical protein